MPLFVSVKCKLREIFLKKKNRSEMIPICLFQPKLAKIERWRQLSAFFYYGFNCQTQCSICLTKLLCVLDLAKKVEYPPPSTYETNKTLPWFNVGGWHRYFIPFNSYTAITELNTFHRKKAKLIQLRNLPLPVSFW